MILSSREKILLHLYLESRNKQVPARVMSASFSQEGISRSTGVARKHIPRNLKALIVKEFIREDKSHIKGAAQRRKVYFPTPEGREEALNIMEKALSSTVIYHDGENEEEELSLEKAIRAYSGGGKDVVLDHLMLVLRSVTEDGVKEILQKEKIDSALDPGKLHVKQLSSAPVTREFVGRDREQQEVNDLLGSRRMIVLYGITGIGKSAFGAHLARDHKGSVFWHSFHEWDTILNFQGPLGTFIEKLGRGGGRLRDGIPDINEFLSYLVDGLRDTNSLIVLDDIQKAPSEFQQLFSGIVANLQQMEGVEFLVLSRKIPDFYSRKDVVVKQTVGEYILEGLDEKSCLSLLGSRGFPPKESHSIFHITRGHPLSLELIETPGTGINAGNLEKYFEEEILRKLPSVEKQILRQASVYRYPVGREALLVQPDHEPEDLSALQRNALVVETSNGNFLVHDLVKGFMTSQLTTHQREAVHGIAATFYLTAEEERSTIEAIYHYLQANNFDEAKSLILKRGRELIYRGHGKELHEYFGSLMDRNLSKRELADLLTLLAEIDTVTGDWGDAEHHLTKALSLYEGQGYSMGMALVLKDLGGLQLRKGVHDEAVKIFKESLSYYQENNDTKGIAKIENNLGIAYWQTGEIDMAKESLTRSLELVERIDDTQGIARALTNLGIIEFQHGGPDSAIDFYNRAMIISRELGDKKTIAQLFDNLGEVYRKLGDVNKALDYFDQGIEIAEAHGFRLITAQLCKDISELLEGEQQLYYRGLAKEICDELGIQDE